MCVLWRHSYFRYLDIGVIFSYTSLFNVFLYTKLKTHWCHIPHCAFFSNDVVILLDLSWNLLLDSGAGRQKSVRDVCALCALFDVLKSLSYICVRYSEISKHLKNEIRYFDLNTTGLVYGKGWLLNVFGLRL